MMEVGVEAALIGNVTAVPVPVAPEVTLALPVIAVVTELLSKAYSVPPGGL